MSNPLIAKRNYARRINQVKQQVKIKHLPTGSEFYIEDNPYMIEPNPHPLADCTEYCDLGNNADLCCNGNRPFCCAEDRLDGNDVVFKLQTI